MYETEKLFHHLFLFIPCTRSRTILACIFLFPFLTISAANSSRLDSLQHLLKSVPVDSTRIILLYNLFEECKNSNPEKAIGYAEDAYSTAIKINNTAWKIRSLSNISLGNYLIGNYEIALKSGNEALDLAVSFGDKKLIALACGYIAVVYTETGDYSKAIDFHLKALNLRQQSGDKKLIATSLNNLAFLHEYMKNYDKALEYYSSALNTFKEVGYSDGISASLSNVGLMLYYKGKYDDALNYFLESYRLDAKLDNKDGIASACLNIGNIYFVKKDFDKALFYYKNGLGINREMGLKREEALSLVNIGMVYEKQKNYSKAIGSFKEGNAIYSSMGSKLDEADSYKYISEIYRATGDFAKALNYFQKYTLLKDTVLNENSSRHIAEMETKFETEKKEREIEVQQLKIREQQLKLGQRNILVLVLAGGVIMIFALALLLFRQQKLKQKQYRDRALIEQKELHIRSIIEGEEKERGRLAQELHDGLGQIISTARISASGAMVKENKESREMLQNSLDLMDRACNDLREISHNLMPSALMRSGLVPALKELSEKINRGGNMKMELHHFGEPFRMDPSFEIALFRVIQELLNNIIKYANATHIQLQLTHDAEELTVLLEDDGTGFDLSGIDKSDGIGWRNIHSRVDFLRGKINVDSQPGKGTTIVIDVPLKKLKT